MDSRGSWGLVSGKAKIFLFPPIIPNQLWITGTLFPVIKQPRRESGQSLVSGGLIKNK
jgi:hypothetical protein